MDLNKIIGRLRSGGVEARTRAQADTERREAATTILSPGEVTGDYDAGRMLQTTLGTGGARSLTHEDLRTFSKNVKTAGKRFKGGITAKSVIEHSAKVDRDRSNKEIHTAVPMQHKAGRLSFITNASPGSDVSRHHVTLDLLNYASAVSSPGKVSELAKYLANGPLKFDCDCGRHTFWFRFISTIGGFNAGRAETGYPKIRNPNLRGVACKHVLRVMHQLTGTTARPVLMKMIEAGRDSVQRKTHLITKAEAEKMAKQQLARTHWKTSRVETSVERNERLGKTEVIQQIVPRSRAAAIKADPVKLDGEKKKFIMQAKKLAAAGILSKKQLDALIAKIGT